MELDKFGVVAMDATDMVNVDGGLSDEAKITIVILLVVLVCL